MNGSAGAENAATSAQPVPATLASIAATPWPGGSSFTRCTQSGAR